ncbi:MAG TPA: hypothetical protein GXX31_01775 [Methanothermobacter sp.]|uniref:Uncharacterized protein n=1 Tax=Methanothermobacter tenebrarum TaxID=680118 RepID=A0ABN6PDT2_9EURY|nr:hypothetical protein [Methanothermobacter tenebrarum]MDI6881653.1 hypothetical protein [Methanothermobacter sp.]BDH79375.1 hypothetical protein MTTB_07540 [Methanothermobacter tenebrarum]HHW16103.1 hypothetical protein [Methanothermobacter sp.]
MNEEGFIFTIDSILMLIPVFIILATVASISLETPHEAPYYNAQDAMQLLILLGEKSTDTNLMTVAENISRGNINGAKAAAQNDLKPILDSFRMNYNLTYYNNNTGTYETLINRGTMPVDGGISSATRSYGGVTFRLYMW